MCWCSKHYVGHTIRERYFSPLVESEQLYDSNARFSAAEWAIATATVTAATPCHSALCEKEPVLFSVQRQLHVN